MADKELKVKKNNVALDCIFVAVLVLLPFLHLAFGVELTDTAYSLGNYENLQNMNLTWTVATFWANMLGKFFTLLPMGHSWIGMKFYTTLVPMAGVVMSYFFLKKYIPRVIVFIGEILAISLFWCPTTILYNYLTYFLFTLVIIFLVKGLEEEKKMLLFVAGIVLAFNVFVRFPNITEAILIVLVIFKGKADKKKVSEIITNTLLCIGGFFAGLLLNVGIIGLICGFNSIPNMVISLFSMTGENAGYKPTQMILAIFKGYTTYTRSFILLLGMTVVCFVSSALIKKHLVRIITIVAQFLFYALFLYWGYKNRVFSINFSEYASMYFWMVVFFLLGNIFAIWTLLRKRRPLAYKLLALSVLVVMWITPLGSNNALYPSMNNLFLVAPVILAMIWEELFSGRNFFEMVDLEARNSMVSTRITCALLTFSVLVSCLLFGFSFIFRDSGFPFKNHTPVENNRILAGMHTSEERAKDISDLTLYIKENNLSDKKAIFYGDLPGLEYILEMPCAISHTWPDLGSFTAKELQTDIDALEEPPVVFVKTTYCEDAIDVPEYAPQKVRILSEYLNKNAYSLKTQIGDICIYYID